MERKHCWLPLIPEALMKTFFCGDGKLGEVFLPLPYGKTL